MSIIYIDGFDTQHDMGYTGRLAYTGTAGLSFSSVGRDGGRCASVQNNTTQDRMLQRTVSTVDISVGFAIRTPSVSPNPIHHPRVLEIVSDVGVIYGIEYHTSSWVLYDNTGTAVKYIPAHRGDWQYIELSLERIGGASRVVWRVGGTSIVYSDTTGVVWNTINRVDFGLRYLYPIPWPNVVEIDFDDMYISNGEMYGDIIVSAHDVDSVYAINAISGSPDVLSAVAQADGNYATGGVGGEIEYKVKDESLYGENIIAVQGCMLFADDGESVLMQTKSKYAVEVCMDAAKTGLFRVATCTLAVNTINETEFSFRFDLYP